MRRLVVALICVWCVAGAAATAGALTGPTMWWSSDAARPDGVVGMPLRGAAETDAIRALLRQRPPSSDERWLIVFPAGSDAQVLTYIRYQLGHTEYPRRIDLSSDGRAPAAQDYTGVILAPGMGITGGWSQRGEHGGFTLYTAAGA